MKNALPKSDRTLGIFFILCSSFFFSLMTLFVRLAGDVPTMQKVFFRNLISVLAAVILLLRDGGGFSVRPGCLKGHIVRSVAGMIGLVCNFYAIDHIGIADANMLNKLSPFFAILLSFLLLRERPTHTDFISVIAAFIGMLFVVKPSAGLASLPAFVGALGGFSAGAAQTFIRYLGKKGERGPEIVLFFSLFSCILSVPFWAFSYQPMETKQLVYLLLAGCAAAGGQLSITSAYRHAPAKEISVYDYAQVVYAALWGLLVFREIPDVMSLIGYVIIIGAAVLRCVIGRHEAPSGEK